MPLKQVVPPDVVTPDFSVGVDAAETTIPEPPLEGVLTAMTASLPL